MARRNFLRSLVGLACTGGSLAPFMASCSSSSVPPAPTSTRSTAQPTPTPGTTSVTTSKSVSFAVIGDYGSGDEEEGAIASLVKSWQPDFITTVGDNNYPVGAASTIDRNVGQFYHEYIFPYKGSYGTGTASNRFWPIYGHRDWDNDGVDMTTPLSGKPYRDYFTLPGNGRYYDFAAGPVHFFMLDTDPHREVDGTSSASQQAQWLKSALAGSQARWKLVYAHHAPYSSAVSVEGIGGSTWMRWPYTQWGANAVLSGYFHSYERLLRDGIVYIVNGASGGNYLSGFAETPVEGSQLQYNKEHGALLVNADQTHIIFRFITAAGSVIDNYTLQ